MQPFIENCLEEFVKTCHDIFGRVSKFVDFEVDQINANDPDGFNSSNIFGCIHYVNENGDHLQSPPFLLKSPPTKSVLTEAVFIQFANEIFFYNHMLPFFNNLETSVLECVPKFYTSFTQSCLQSDEGLIILENLSHGRYKNAPWKTFLDYNHLSVMIRSLGRFHAYSYLAKELDPLHFLAHAFPLNPIHLTLLGKCPGYMTKTGGRGVERLATQSEYKSLVPGIQELLNNADEIVMNIFKNERHNPWAVVCHGDYISGNVMFKYEKDQPIDIKMFDFAMSTYSSPVLDLSLLLYMNANQQVRDLHFDQLIDDYCHGLSSLPIPVAHLPSRDDILKEFHSRAFYAYLLASIYLPLIIPYDFKLKTLEQFIPPEYTGYHDFDLPFEVQSDMTLIVGGEVATEALADILKDMIKRGFI